jgi:hypothetical protein
VLSAILALAISPVGAGAIATLGADITSAARSLCCPQAANIKSVMIKINLLKMLIYISNAYFSSSFILIAILMQI